jgi:hypothetical protein
VTQDVRSGPGDLVPGEQVAGYQVQEQIGRGGMAVVYRALDLRLGRLVALKVLAPDLGEDDAFRQRFIRESRAAAGVDHPHIIPVFEAGEASGVLFIAMRYVSHGDVRSLLDAEGRLTAARTAAITSQVASALDAAHAYGLVHRDVKPGNMLLGEASGRGSEHVYLSDFGLSKYSLSPSTLTSTGQFLGTLDYVSPEQIQGQPVDGRADQYALACTVVEMLTGAPPFHRDDTTALMWAQLEAEPPRPSERRPDLPSAVDQVIARAMAKSPASRYPTCRDFAAALSAALAAGSEARAADPARNQADQQGWPRPGPGTGQARSGPGARQARSGPGAPQARSGRDWHDDGAARPAGPVPSRNAGIGNTARDYAQPPQPQAPRRPTEHSGFARAPQTRYDNAIQGTGPTPADRARQARGRAAPRGPRPSRRNKVLATLIVVIGLAGLGGIGFKLLYHPAAPAGPSAGSTTPAGTLGPAATVREYFAAINNHHYAQAWRLSGQTQTESLAKFTSGYAGTAHDRITNVSVSGNVVSLTLHAVQTDGSVKTYLGSYTVLNGVITAATVNQIS